jgi:tetratricopeptide (TPR) repeat protein/transglutaminase-like putative cysteine protease
VFHPDLLEATARLGHAQGPEAYAALRAVWDTWDRADPTQVEEVLAVASRTEALGEPARAYATLLGAYARLRRGDTAAAAKATKALGYVDHFMAVGPFDNEGKVGFDTVFGPEADFATPIVPGRAYSGKERPVRWRTVPDAFPYGYVDFESLMRPDKKTCVYATTFVSSKTARDRDITVWAGSGGAIKVFWNGAVVLSDAAERRYDADRYAATVRLGRGTSNLTVKVCSTDTAPVVSLRLADDRGRPDPTLLTTNSLEASTAAAETVNALGKAKPKAKATGAKGVEGPVQTFERLVAEKRAHADDLEAYTRYLVATGGDDPAVHRARNLAETAADASPTIPRLLLAAELAEDRNQRAAWVERAEKLVPKKKVDTRVSLARAAVARESLNVREAFPLYAEVLRVDPDNVAAVRGEVELYNDVGLKRTALALLERASERNPSSVLLLNMYASQLRALGRDTDAADVEARYSAFRFDDRTLLARMIDLGVARRQKAAAERWIDRLLAVQPDEQWALGTAARAYRALGEPERAVATFERALALSPEDVGTLRALADLQGDLGRRTEQLSLLGRVLQVEPQNKDVREYVEHLEPSGSRLDEGFAWESERFLKERQAPAQGQNRRTILDMTVTTVFDNGLSSKFRQIVFQPLTEAAAALARQYAFQYEADAERVQLRGARVFRGDGSVDEAIESGEGAADDPSIAMYTSARTFYIQFPRLEAGDVIELRYRTDSMSSQNQFADYFGDVEYLQSPEPTGHAEYVLITPKSRKLYVDTRRLPGLSQSVDEKGNLRIYRFAADKVPSLSPEPSMPPWPSVLGFVHVSTYSSWKDLGRWYWGISKDQLDVDEETRKLAHKIVQGKTTELDKVRAVYDWVVTNTRYVALEFGIYGYKPHRCVQTVSRGWGDCKDKAAVIVTLLKELGIDSTMVIVRSGMRGDFDSTVASLAPFDHAIAYVPSLDLYLDGTAEFTGSSELPGMDQGAIALQVNRGDSKLVRLPVPDPGKSVRKREVVATLRKDGGAQLEVSFETTGTSASSWRRRFHAEGTRRDRLSEDLGGEFSGFELAPGATGVQVGSLDDLEQPVTIKVHGNASRLGRQEGNELSVPVTPGFRLTGTYASLSARRLAVRLPPLGTLDDTFTVKIPAGMRIVSAPPETKKDGPFGSYSVTVERDAGKVVVRSRLVMKVLTVLPEQYAAFKQFCADADSAMTPRLVLGPG